MTWTSTAFWLLFPGLGLYVGFKLISAEEPKWAKNGQQGRSAYQQFRINVALLYATLAIVVGTVITNWPPTAQNFHPIMHHVVFILSTFSLGVISGRVVRILSKLETIRKPLDRGKG